jgi:hypothetical protein
MVSTIERPNPVPSSLVRSRQLEARLLVLLSRHGPLTVPELHRETFVLKHRYDVDVDGRYTNALHCVQSHLRWLEERGLVEPTERDGTVAWRPTAAGFRSDTEVSVCESTGPLTAGDVGEEYR